MLTPADLATDSASGYKYVRSASAGPNGGGKTVLWKAEIRRGSMLWRSEYFRRPIDAAKACCDYINTNDLPDPKKLKTAGHAYDIESTERDPEVESALGVLRDHRAQKAGRQGYVYCIGEVDEHGELTDYVKIGYSVNPRKRIAELQCGNPRRLRMIGFIEGTQADEANMHSAYLEYNVMQEWFRATDGLIEQFQEDRSSS